MRTKLAFPYFFSSLFIGFFLPFLGLFLQARGLSPWQIGVAISSFVGPRAITPLFWGWLADKYQCAEKVIFFTYLASLSCLILLLDQLDFLYISLILFLISFFWSGVTPLLDALTIKRLNGDPKFYGRIRLWGSVGYLLAVTIAGALLEIYDADILVYVWIVIQITGLLCVYYNENHPKYSIKDPIFNSQGILSYRFPFTRPEIMLFLGATFLMASAHSTYGTYYSLLLHDVGYGTQTIGRLFSVAVIAEIVVLFFMSKLFNSFTLKQMLIFSFGAAIVRYLLIGYFASSLLLLGFAQLLHSFTFGMYHASAVIHVSTLFPDRASVKGQAIYAIASFGLGGVFGSTVAGTLWKDYGGETVFLTLSGFSTLGLFLLVLSFKCSGGKNCP